jgi:hypothetical protein
LRLYERILVSNMFIGLVTVPVYVFLKSFPFLVVFGVGIITTLTVLILFFYFLSVRFVGTWAVLQKFSVTLPTSLVLTRLVEYVPRNPYLDYVVLFLVGYTVSTPLIFLTYRVTRWFYDKKR